MARNAPGPGVIPEALDAATSGPSGTGTIFDVPLAGWSFYRAYEPEIKQIITEPPKNVPYMDPAESSGDAMGDGFYKWYNLGR